MIRPDRNRAPVSSALPARANAPSSRPAAACALARSNMSSARCFSWLEVRALAAASCDAVTELGRPSRAPQVSRVAATLVWVKPNTHGQGGGCSARMASVLRAARSRAPSAAGRSPAAACARASTVASHAVAMAGAASPSCRCARRTRDRPGRRSQHRPQTRPGSRTGRRSVRGRRVSWARPGLLARRVPRVKTARTAGTGRMAAMARRARTAIRFSRRRMIRMRWCVGGTGPLRPSPALR